MSKLYIVYFTPRYYPHLGGVENIVMNLAERLASHGHIIKVVAGEPYLNRTVIEEMNKVEIIRVPVYAPNEAYYIPRDKGIIYKILSDNIDIVHMHSVHSIISLIPFKIKESSNVKWKLILTPHFSTPGYTFLRRIIWKFIWRNYVRNKLKYVDLIHVTTPLEKEFFTKYFSFSGHKIIEIPIGISEDVFKYKWKDLNSDYLFYSGRIEKYKNIDLMIKAVEYLLEKGYKLRLIINGSGSYKKKLVKKVKDKLKNLSKQFITVGPPTHREKYLELLSNARAAISLSIAENFNIFLAEAYVMNVPIIATKQAAAFYPEIANIKVLAPKYIANVILEVISRREPRKYTYKLKSWTEVINDFKKTYRKNVFTT